jgi:hypothetical protein
MAIRTAPRRRPQPWSAVVRGAHTLPVKVLIALAAAAVIGLGAWRLLADVRQGRSRAGLGGALLGLAALGFVAVLARSMGYFSVAAVALLFVPFALAARWSLQGGRGRREGPSGTAAGLETAAPSARRRAAQLLTWPLAIVLALLAAVAGALAAVAASYR